MEIKTGKTIGNRLSFHIVDGKDEFDGQIFIGDVRRPLSEFCDMKQMLPLFLLFYAKTLNIETEITALKVRAEAMSVAMSAEVANELSK